MNGASSETPFVDRLMQAYPGMKVANKSEVEKKLKTITDGSHEKLQLIVDFDNTLTRHHKNGTLTDCSWAVMENSPLLPKDYNNKTNALRAKYLPIETDPNLTIDEKIPHMVEWYTQAQYWPENLKKVQAKKKKKLVKSNKSISRNNFLTKFHFLPFVKWPKINF